MAAQRGSAPSQPGDATGRKKAQLAKEHEKEQKEAASRMAMITAENERARRDDVVDYADGMPVVAVDPDPVTDVSQVVVDEADDDDALLAALESGKADAGVLAKVAARYRAAKARAEGDVIDQGVTVVDADTAIIRVNADIKQMTYPSGVYWDFEAGRRYRVPIAVAEHLERLGLVWH